MTALAEFVRQRMDAQDMRWFADVARATTEWDAPPRGKGVGLSADTIARIVYGQRKTVQERTLHLLARALGTSPALLRLYIEDRTRDEPREFRLPRAANHRLVTTRVHRAWEEGFRAIADALDEAYQAGYTQARHDLAAAPDPVAIAEAATSDRVAG